MPVPPPKGHAGRVTRSAISQVPGQRGDADWSASPFFYGTVTVTAPTLKTTPLNALHRELNARMVDFGGWDMTLHYGLEIEEHHAVPPASGLLYVLHTLAIDGVGA